MAFSLDNPRFCVESREDSMETAAPDGLSVIIHDFSIYTFVRGFCSLVTARDAMGG